MAPSLEKGLFFASKNPLSAGEGLGAAAAAVRFYAKENPSPPSSNKSNKQKKAKFKK